MLKSPTHSTPVLGLKIRSRIRTAWCTAAKCLAQACMERALVQILVAVANIQMRTLKAEAEKVFVRTAVVHESVGPKARASALAQAQGLWDHGVKPALQHLRMCRKGSRSTFRHRAGEDETRQRACGNPRDGAAGPRKSSLFFLTHRRIH